MSRLRLALDRALYRLVLLLAAPVIPLRLWWRGAREPGYRRHWGERLGFVPLDVPTGALWVHAVSVGETRAAAPLIAELRRRHPDAPVVVSCMTATGRATAEQLYGGFARVVFLPYDYRGAMRRFLARLQPRLGVLMETELWPNLIVAAAEAGVPLALANARLSQRSARRYARWLPGLVRASLARLAAVVAQTAADADRLTGLGARGVVVCGNLKFDIEPPAGLVGRGRGWRAQWGGRPVVLAASTREGEEALLLDARGALPADALLVVVPRHPQRFDAVAALVASRGLKSVRRSEWAEGTPLPADVRVLVGDSLGELFAWYAAADIAYVGGSLLPLGGQNLIEAAAVGCPVLVGPHTFNFADATAQAITAGAAWRGADADGVMREAAALLADASRRRAMGEAGLAWSRGHRGAAARTAEALAGL